MAKGLVLISGVNGFIAAHTAKSFLESGYSVRGTVRRISSAQALLDGPFKEYAVTGRFQVVEVPDITVNGAFDEAVQGVTAIAHLASPISFSFTDPDPVLHASVNGTTNILNSALKAGPQLKTVVVTSSIVSVGNLTETRSQPFTEADWNNGAEDEVKRLGKQTPGPVIYAASKVAAEKAFWNFRDEKKPAFTMTAINPVFVIGAPVVEPKTAEEVGGTVARIWAVFSGAEYANLIVGHDVDVRDVAKLHVYPIKHPSETNGHRFIASAAFSPPQAYADILRKAFPEAKDRILEGKPREGYPPNYQLEPKRIDGSKAEGILGGYIPFEESVVNTAKAFQSLL